MSFTKKLADGHTYEMLICKKLRRNGWNVLPAYEIRNTKKSPRLFTSECGDLVIPDLLALKDDKIMWVEIKSKSAFTWHRKTGTWQTGLDINHWNDYKKVYEITGLPVWIYFVHKTGHNAVDTPDDLNSPVGIYKQHIDRLIKTVDHKHINHGRYGMVYWQECDLIKLGVR